MSSPNQAEMTRSTYDSKAKMVIVGESGVGKSCLLQRFCSGFFVAEYDATIGIDFVVKTVRHQKERVKLQIWDTAGKERFRSITRSYYRGADVILLVCDVTQPGSFASLSKWLDEIKAFTNHPRPEVLLVANKVDSGLRTVSSEDVQEYAQRFGLKFVETSAKDNTNVTTAFYTLLNLHMEKNDPPPTEKVNPPPTRECWCGIL